MIIQKVIIENFRSFYGEQTIEFSTDSEKNTTIIYAMNGVGKTNILNAILWCLHNQFSPSFKNPDDLLNWQARSRNRKSYHVTVEFIQDETVFSVKRSGGDINNFKVFRIEEGNTEELGMNPSVFINSIIPKDMANYFISDGEGGNLTVDTQGMISVKRSIRDILGFQVAEKALSDLQKIKREYREELNKVDVVGKLAETEERLGRFEDSIARNEKELEDNIEALENYKLQLDQIDNELASTSIFAIRQQHEERARTERQLTQARNDLRNFESKKIGLLREYSWVAFSHKLANSDLDFMDVEKAKKTVPAPFDEQLVSDILEASKCICGAPITPGSQSYKNLVEMLGKATNPDILNRLQKARSRLTAIKTLAPQAKDRLDSNFQLCDKTERTVKSLEQRLEELSLSIQGFDSESIEKVERTRRVLRQKISETERTIGRKQNRIEEMKATKKDLEGQVGRMQGLSPRAVVCRGKIKLVENIENVITEELKSTLDSIQGTLEEKINGFLDKYLRQDYTAKMTSDFKIGLIDRQGRLVPPGGGQGAILSFIYISSLIAIARERRDLKSNILTAGAIAPLIFDAPFSKLDRSYAPNIARELPKLVDQLILLMYQDKGKNVDKVLLEEGKLGKEYYLTEEIAGPQGAREIQTMEINGVREPVTVYDARFDKVIVKKVTDYV